MTPEKRLMNEIRIECGRRGWVVIRMNVGKVRMDNGRWFDTGIPKGFPDMMVLTNDGRAFFVETKIKPRKPTKQQVEKLNLLQSLGFKAEVIYDIDEFKDKFT